jgi:hypothetical protein
MRKIVFAILIATATFAFGQSSNAKKGTMWGAGLGAVAGGLIGHHGSSALIGAAVGAGVGYVVGNEKDKEKAQKMSEQSRSNNYAHNETGPFPGTRWQLMDWSPKQSKVDFASKTFEFGKDAWVKTTTKYKDGRTTADSESYRVVDDILIVNKGDYLVNYHFTIQGSQMTVTTEKGRATLKRI